MKVFVAGDYVPRNRISEMLNRNDYSFFDNLRVINRSVDFSIINLESPVVNGDAIPIKKTGPNLSCTANAVSALSYAGFSCVTLANNHFYDYGEKGVDDTISTCEEHGMFYVGGGRSLREASKTLCVNVVSKRLAIINACENEWSIATEITGGSAPLDVVQICRAIKNAKQESDFVMVITHGGSEHFQLPSPRMKKTYRFFIENGADAVINHHQHCFSGYEIYEGKPIFYGLGNFCFDRNPSDNKWNSGYSVILDFDDMTSYEILPYIQCADKPIVDFQQDNKQFFETIDHLNKIIQDDNVLEENYNEFISSKKSFLSFLEPYNSKLAKLLFAKKLLPSFLTDAKKRIVLELFRCESHRDVMFKLLKK